MIVVSVGTNLRFKKKGRIMGAVCFICSIIRSWTPNTEEGMSFISQRQRKNKEPGAEF
jgi:hypothetical protein